ncbi:hypothetical protein BCR35DRAFT_308410 [Leucosporidium creatinivorum]|uniref:SH3 domain-containing protein n=1 Tax=Leucosporidium creatinivorum TaxID=106004 RepID=A0A1Y2E619_9BASI|nr:hypothetical protein BCR35DRAFT_308410 [Leucosporidium creatinivorum]
MSTPWQAVLASPAEKEAFFSLLDEYWARDPTAAAPAPRPAARVVAPPAPLSSYSPAAPTPRPPSAPTSSPRTSASTFIADRALQNTTATSAALRNAGLSAGAAGTLSKFGAAHHEQLAPHVAAGAKAGWANRNAISGGQVEAEPAPKGPPPKGPKPPTGLSQSRSIAGGFDTSSGKNFGKTLFASKGPMSDAERKANVFKEPLATKAAPRTYSHTPPPMRGSPAPPTPSAGLGTATALYDYEGTDPSDLPCLEGEVLTVIEHVSDDWWKCRNPAGAEGIIPSSYLQAN